MRSWQYYISNCVQYYSTVLAFRVSNLSLKLKMFLRNLANVGKSKSLDADNPPDPGTLIKNCLEGEHQCSHSEKARDLELNKVLLLRSFSFGTALLCRDILQSTEGIILIGPKRKMVH